MNTYPRLLALVLFVVAAWLTACGPSPASQPNAGSSPSTVASGGSVPDPLQTMEEAAEDIIDRAPSGTWAIIAADVTAITDAWKAYRPQAPAAGASQVTQDALSAALTRLQTASTAQNPADTMQAANDVSAAVIELFALYNPVVPATIGQLDVLERQVVLDVAANDYPAAAASLAKTKAAWESVKPSVLSHNGANVATQFEASLATQETAVQTKNASAATAEAKNGLEIVDAFEKLY